MVDPNEKEKEQEKKEEFPIEDFDVNDFDEQMAEVARRHGIKREE